MPWSLTKTSLGRRQFIWLTFPRHYPSARSARTETMEDHSSLIWFRLMFSISLCLPGPPRVDQALPYQSLIKKMVPQVNLMEAVLQLRSPVTLVYIRLSKLTPIHHQNNNWVNSRCFFMISYMYTVHWGLLPTSHFHSSPTTTHSFRSLFSVYQFEFCLVSTELNQGHLYDP